jgi:dihydrolipoamide dehydrogenase
MDIEVINAYKKILDK